MFILPELGPRLNPNRSSLSTWLQSSHNYIFLNEWKNKDEPLIPRLYNIFKRKRENNEIKNNTLYSPITSAWRCFNFTSRLLVRPDNFIELHFKLEKEREKKSLCCACLRFIFKISYNLWKHWGAISYLHWHLISQVDSEITNWCGFPLRPIILHQFSWPLRVLLN